MAEARRIPSRTVVTLAILVYTDCRPVAVDEVSCAQRSMRVRATGGCPGVTLFPLSHRGAIAKYECGKRAVHLAESAYVTLNVASRVRSGSELLALSAILVTHLMSDKDRMTL